LVGLALIAKLGWKVLSQIKAKYLQNGKWNYENKTPVEAGACFQISSKSSPSFWNSPWIPQDSSFRPRPRNNSNFSFPNLLISVLISQPTKSWIPSLVNNLFDVSAQKILRMRISSSALSDKLIFLHNPFGDFSTKSAYRGIA
jgi:hypothetical protein